MATQAPGAWSSPRLPSAQDPSSLWFLSSSVSLAGSPCLPACYIQGPPRPHLLASQTQLFHHQMLFTVSDQNTCILSLSWSPIPTACHQETLSAPPLHSQTQCPWCHGQRPLPMPEPLNPTAGPAAAHPHRGGGTSPTGPTAHPGPSYSVQLSVPCQPQPATQSSRPPHTEGTPHLV